MRWLVVLSFVAACGGLASVPPAPPRRAALGLSMSSVTLANGMHVVVVTDPSAREVQVTTRYAVGSAEDPRDKAGMAHLVEHLLFQPLLGSQSLMAQLETIATSFNAFTSFDSTIYVSRAAPEYLEKLITIEATRVGFRCKSIQEAQFLRERDVVLDEIRQSTAFEDLTYSVHRGLFEAGHPYRRQIGGSLQTVSAVSFADACAFADEHYTTDGTVMVVSGNITMPLVTTMLGKLMNRIARRPKGTRSTVPRAEPSTEPTPVLAPVDDGAVVFAWTLPLDPLSAVRALALVPTLRTAIDSKVDGRVSVVRLGGERVPLVGVVVERNLGEDAAAITAAVRSAVDELLPEALAMSATFDLGQLTFDHTQQSAIRDLYAGLEDGSNRDSRLALYVGSGRDPAEALAAEFAAVRDLTSANAASLAKSTFAFSRASIVELLPAERPQGRNLTVAPQRHDINQQRDVPNPDDATRPAQPLEDIPVPAVTKTLPNGMRVVLVSHSSVPTVEMRLVFASGRADEPAARPGAASVAAYGLEFDPRHLNDVVKFYAAGGEQTVDVNVDETSFVVCGVDMHLDILLAGLRRWVRDGKYGDTADSVAAALREEQKHSDEDTTLAGAWYPAVYGANHPYARQGTALEVRSLSTSDAEAFRSAHYTPDNATLVIAGHFDVALAERWVEYLFGSWSGHATRPPSDTSAHVEPAAFSMAHDSTLTRLQIAISADAGTRAQRLVAAAILRAGRAASARSRLSGRGGHRGAPPREPVCSRRVCRKRPCRRRDDVSARWASAAHG